MRRKKFVILQVAVLVFASFLFPPYLFAVGSSGFENASYSAKTLAQANAVIARPQDASTILANPAGIGELEGIQVMGGFQAVDYRTFHRNKVTGDHNQGNAKILPIPSFYLSLNPGNLFDDRISFGVAVNSPFGLSSSFPVEGMAKYTGIKNKLKMAATTIAGSLKVTDKVSVGGGAINYYIYKYYQTFNYPNGFILSAAGQPDGKATTNTDGFGWGWNVGLLIKPLPKHRLAVSYRSKAVVQTHGQVFIEDMVNGLAQGYDTAPHFVSGAHSDVPLPANLTLGYAYEPSPKWSTEFDMGLTFWNVFKDQDFRFDRPNATINALGRIPRDYMMSWSFHWGADYRVRDNLDLLGGFFFYEAAGPKNHVDNFLPDANRFGWTFGTSYKLGERTSLDFAYIFILLASRHISNPVALAKLGTDIDGRYTSIIHGPMITVTYRFDFPFEKRFSTTSQQPTVKTKSPILREFKPVGK